MGLAMRNLIIIINVWVKKAYTFIYTNLKIYTYIAIW